MRDLNFRFIFKNHSVYIVTALVLFLILACSNKSSLPDDKDGIDQVEDSLHLDLSYLSLGKSSTTPFMKGTFITFWNKSGWNSTDWENHMKEMLEVGIKTLIVQFTAYEDNVWIESNNANSTNKYPHVLGLLLDAAEKYDMGVFVGLYFSENYWENTKDLPTLKIHTQRSNQFANEIWGANKKKKSLKGWYISHEPASYYYRTSEDLKILKDQLINPIANHCKALSGKPVSIAPFFNYDLTDINTFSSFMISMGSTNVDLIILQDGIGVFHCDLESLESYYLAANNALYEIGNFKGAFWADIETFRFKDKDTAIMKPEAMEILTQKLSIVSPHVSNIVTFQYYNDMCAKGPNGIQAHKLRNDYMNYLE